MMGDKLPDVVNRQVSDINVLKVCFWKVRFKGLFGIGIEVKREHDVHPGLAKTTTRSAATREEIEHLDSPTVLHRNRPLLGTS